MAEYLFTAAGLIVHKSGSIVSGGNFSITTPPGTKLLILGNGVYRGPIAVTFSGGNASGMVPGTVAGAGTIAPTSLKNKTETLAVIRDKDEGTLVGTATPSGGGPPVPINIPCVCSSVQTKVLGE
jgi:hypothetical protein